MQNVIQIDSEAMEKTGKTETLALRLYDDQVRHIADKRRDMRLKWKASFVRLLIDQSMLADATGYDERDRLLKRISGTMRQEEE